MVPLTDCVAEDGNGVGVQSLRQPDVTDGIVDVPTVVNGVVTADDEVTVVIAVGEVTDITTVGKVTVVIVGAVVTNVVIDVVADAVLSGVDVNAEQKPRTDTTIL